MTVITGSNTVMIEERESAGLLLINKLYEKQRVGPPSPGTLTIQTDADLLRDQELSGSSL